LWGARRPLAAARAVIFPSRVDDPDHPEAPPELVQACRELPKGKNATANDTPRMRLFDFIERLVQWESTTDEDVLNTARRLIRLATNDNPPPLLDPFAGGGSIPLEAQRLGLEAHASDLNPVAVMINKAQIEIPPRFANRPPVNPEDRAENQNTRSKNQDGNAKRKKAQGKLELKTTWKGAAGLAADVRYYGQWMRDEAFKRIGHLYPQYVPPTQQGEVGNGAKPETVIAWLWARTVTCPNPACSCQMPLVSSFELSKKTGKRTWIVPTKDSDKNRMRFEIKSGEGKPSEPSKTGRGAKFRCLCCGMPVSDTHIKAEGMHDRMGSQLMAIVTEGKKGRNYHAPTSEHESITKQAEPSWTPNFELSGDRRAIWCPLYGLDTFDKLFTPRQLVALTTFSDLVAEARERCFRDAVDAGLPNDDVPLREGGAGARAYAEAVSVYLAFALDKMTTTNSAICTWQTEPTRLVAAFSRQAIPMMWDYAESNPFSNAAGDYLLCIESASKVIDNFVPVSTGYVIQQDATRIENDRVCIISTDPPYYDNIGYADLSDFFYIWLRRSLRDVFPNIFSTLLTPKNPELIAAPHRHEGSWDAAAELNQPEESGQAVKRSPPNAIRTPLV